MSRIWCLGSINIDMFYDVPHLPLPGETLAATGHSVGLGGKGANQSVAAARAGASVVHVGAVGGEGGWTLERLQQFGVDTSEIETVSVPTGHAIITVDTKGENAIVLFPGANRALDLVRVQAAMSGARHGDLLLMQNETNLQAEVAQWAASQGVSVWYSAAPFDAAAVQKVLPHIQALLVNEVEAAQLEQAFGTSIEAMGVAHVVITLGAKGARWIDTVHGKSFEIPGLKVKAVDTTAAGDTFAGYLAAGIAEGMSPRDAMILASRAAALKVTRHGTADAIPTRAEVDAFAP